MIAGLSFGGQVALATAAQAPARVRVLVLVDAVLDGVAWDDASASGSEQVARAVREGGVEAGRRAWLAHPLFATASEHADLSARLAEMLDSYAGQHWLGQDPHRPADVALIDVLEKVSVPTTVIVGDRDVPCFREMSAILGARIPGARLVTITGAGHMTPMEAPDETVLAIRQALVAQPRGR